MSEQLNTIKDRAKELLNAGGDLFRKGRDKAEDFVEDQVDNWPKNKTRISEFASGVGQKATSKNVLIPLLAALAGGTAAGGLTAIEKKSPWEDKDDRRKRILRNALLGAGAAGAAGYLLPAGLDQLNEVRPVDEPDSVVAGMRHPLVMGGTGVAAFLGLNRGSKADVGQAQQHLINLLKTKSRDAGTPLSQATAAITGQQSSRGLSSHLSSLFTNADTQADAFNVLKGVGGDEQTALRALREAHVSTTPLLKNPDFKTKLLRELADRTHGLVGDSAEPIIGRGTRMFGSPRTRLLASLLAGVSLPIAGSYAAGKLTGEY